MLGVLAPDLGDDGMVGRGNREALEGVGAALVGSIRRDIGEFREKEIWTTGVGDNLTKCDVGNAFHGCQD